MNYKIQFASLITFLLISSLTIAQYNRAPSMLDKGTTPKSDAQVIITAAVLGFVELHATENAPFAFGYDHTAESSKKAVMDSVLLKLNEALKKSGSKNKCVVVSTPSYGQYQTPKNLIRPEVSNVIHAGRAGLTGPQKGYFTGIRNAADKGASLQYVGPGAYTGCVYEIYKGGVSLDGDLSKTFSTMQDEAHVMGFGKGRWVPSKDYPEHELTMKNHGFIGGLTGQGPLRKNKMDMNHKVPSAWVKVELAGYVHGMIRGMYYQQELIEAKKCDSSRVCEIAVSTTTKLASCFACSVFMTANGKPASFTHLGRADSWTVEANDHIATGTPILGRAHCNDKWAKECRLILLKGIDIMQKQGPLTATGSKSFKLLAEMRQKLDDDKEGYKSANLFLDAITVHGKFTKSVDNVLK
jgi:hypothetical protein